MDVRLIEACLPNLNRFVGIEPRKDIIEDAKANLNKLRGEDLKVILSFLNSGWVIVLLLLSSPFSTLVCFMKIYTLRGDVSSKPNPRRATNTATNAYKLIRASSGQLASRNNSSLHNVHPHSHPK